MEDTELMVLIKADLDMIYVDEAKQALLTQCLAASKALIQREGIVLTDSIEDAQLIVMYASYLYRKRGTSEPMPRMLRYAMNNRLLHEKGGAADEA